MDAILSLVAAQIGLRTSFLTHITVGDNRNHVIAAYNDPDGCGIAADTELLLENTFCSAISGSTEPEPLIINDTHGDPFFRTHAAAVASPGIGSFVGVPIVLSTGQFYGTLCAVDPEPQHLTMQQVDLLVVLGRIIATQIERDQELAHRRQVEAAQEQLYRAAQEAVREREALLAIASHELKNPLTSLLGYAHLLQRRMSTDASRSDRDERAVEIIIAQGERLNRMLTDLMDMSRVDSDQFTVELLPLDLSTLVHHLADEIRPTISNHTLIIEDTESPVMVQGDEVRLTQVLRNLLGNAVKYSPAGGTITVALVTHPDQACLSVRNEGIGIPAAALPNISQRFYRAPNSMEQPINGFGIGLYVVKQIVTRHGGTIAIASTEGVGTTVTVCLPLTRS